jgi:uncharacterized membrane protein
MKKIFIPFCFLFFLFSCSPNPNKIESTANKDTTRVVTHLVKKLKEYKGVYCPGQFKSAEKSELFTFYDSVQKQLDSLYNKIIPSHYPNQTVFMDFIGIADSLSTNTGFRTSITKLISIEFKNAFNSAIPYEYWCMGNEPFWQIQISEKENLIDFYDPMIPKFYHFNFSKAKIEDGKTIYTADDKASGNTIKITITKEKCSDGMSERKYNYSSEAVLNGKTYKGCAIAFGEGVQSTM